MGEGATLRSPLIVTLIASALCWALYVFMADDPVLGTGLAHRAIELVALATTGIFAILLAGTLVLAFIHNVTEAPATGFQQVIVYALLTFAVTFGGLRILGFDLFEVVTTSAVVTAIVGFAMQPTLTSMIAGLALHADRAVHIGDSIMLDGEPVEIMSMNWRAAIGRRDDGRIVVVPHGKITEAATQVLRAGEAHRMQVFFHGPLNYPPQQICDLVREAVSDLPLVQHARSVSVAPVEFDILKQATRFRVQCWTRHPFAQDVIEGETIRRVWYLFQRDRISFPEPLAQVGAPTFTSHANEALPTAEEASPHIAALLGKRAGNAELAISFAANGQYLLYAPDERVILPEWAEGWGLILYRGEGRPVAEVDLAPDIEAAHAALRVQHLGPNATMARLTDSLSKVIGPYAKLAVKRAGMRAESYEELCRAVALEIDDEAKRRQFLREVLPAAIRAIGPGTILEGRRNASGILSAEPSMRALTELVVLAIPPAEFAKMASAASAAAV